MEAVKQDGKALQDASRKLRTDRDFVLLKFDLSSVPPSSIARAELTYSVANGGNQADLHGLKVGWDMASVTYNSLPMPSTAWPFSQADADALYGPSVNDLPGSSPGPHTVDVTASVAAWLDGTPNYGWIAVPTVSAPAPSRAPHACASADGACLATAVR